jgi:hypothetical protein
MTPDMKSPKMVPKWSTPLAALLTIAVVMVARKPALFTDPRFWAEEASHFYTRFLNESTLTALGYVHVGSYQLLTNAIVVLATHVPLWAAPVVTTYLAFGVLLFVAYQIGILLREYQIGRIASALLLIAFALQWGMYEVALTATNVQWIAGLSTLVLLALPCAWLDRNLRLSGLWLLLCGLSGIPAAICAPAFAVKALVFRSRSTALAAAILSVCVAVQALCVVLGDTSGRDLHKTWAVLLMPTLMQTAIEPFTGPEPIFLVGTYINSALPKVGMLLLATAGAGAAIIALAGLLARDAAKDRIVWVVLFAWLYVSVAQTVGALHPAQLVTASGARYYVFGSTASFLLFTLATTNVAKAARATALGALALACFAGLSQRMVGEWTQSLLNGPSWKQQARACKAEERCVVHAWPHDGTVYLIIEGSKVRSSYFPDRLPDLAPGPP